MRASALPALLVILMVLLVTGGAASALPGATRPPGTWQQKVIPFQPMRGRRFSVSGQYFVSYWTRPANGPSGATVVARSLVGSNEENINFELPDGYQVWLNSAATTRRGQVVAAGVWVGPSRVPEGFVREWDRRGHRLRDIRLGAYEPERLCVAPGGVLWTFGQNWADEVSGVSYPTIQRLAWTGRQLGQYLARTEIPLPDLNLSARLAIAGGSRGAAFLGCSNTTAGIYLASERRFFGVRAGKEAAAAEASAPLPIGVSVTGMAIVDTGSVVASYVDRTPGPGRAVQTGLYELSIPETMGAKRSGTGSGVHSSGQTPRQELPWRRLVSQTTTARPLSFPVVLGRDGSSVIYTEGGRGSVHRDGLSLYWMNVDVLPTKEDGSGR